MRGFREAITGRDATRGREDSESGRTVAEISAAWQQRLGAKRRRLAEQAEKEREHRARVEAQARKKHLEDIALRAPAVWKETAAWIAKRTPKGYDRAVELLSDLKDAAAIADCREEFDRQLHNLRNLHAGNPSLMRRFRDAGLAG